MSEATRFVFSSQQLFNEATVAFKLELPFKLFEQLLKCKVILQFWKIGERRLEDADEKYDRSIGTYVIMRNKLSLLIYGRIFL